MCAAEKMRNFRLISCKNPEFVRFRDLLVFASGFIIIIREGQNIASTIKRERRAEMSSLADGMEDYLKKLLNLSASGYIEIKRKELAAKFRCVPSQVNYVLETRFTLENGFCVESRRGGKGFVSIKKLNQPARELLSILLPEIIEGKISGEKAKMLLSKFYEEKFISLRERKLIESFLNTLYSLEEESQRARLRSLLWKNLLVVLAE